MQPLKVTSYCSTRADEFELYLTIVVLTFINQFCDNMKDEWALMIKKIEHYLDLWDCALIEKLTMNAKDLFEKK